MERLTIKELRLVTDQNKANDKLSRLEDIEEDLGIDLITLFKALKNGAFIEMFDEIKELKPEWLAYEYDTLVKGIGWGYKGKNGVASGVLFFKQYGEKWALTKGELKDDK